MTEKQKTNAKKLAKVLKWLETNANVRIFGKQRLVARKDKPIKSLDDVVSLNDRSLLVWYGRAKRLEGSTACEWNEAMIGAWPITADDNGEGEGDGE